MTGTEVALILGQVAVLVTAIGGLIVQLRSNQKVGEQLNRQDEKLEAVHTSTNGMASRNEAIAKKLGIAEGKAEEKNDAEIKQRIETGVGE